MAHFPPVVIETMLRAHYLGYPDVDQPGTPSVQSAVLQLKSLGLVGDDGRATERGSAWVRMICSTPLPEQRVRWVDPREED